MKSFQQFVTEAYDKELEGQASRKPGEGGRIRASRKKRDIDKTRVKAAGGGKTTPASDYKPRADIGTNKPRSRHQQQPTQDRHTQQLTPQQRQRKAREERIARQKGAKTKTADELLSTKKKTVDPKYKATKASGLTQKERQSLTRRGEKKLRDLRLQSTGKTKESELKHAITHKEVARRKKELK